MRKQKLDKEVKEKLKNKLVESVKFIKHNKHISKAKLIDALCDSNDFKRSFRTIDSYLSQEKNGTIEIPLAFFEFFIKHYPETSQFFFSHMSSSDALRLGKLYKKNEIPSNFFETYIKLFPDTTDICFSNMSPSDKIDLLELHNWNEAPQDFRKALIKLFPETKKVLYLPNRERRLHFLKKYGLTDAEILEQEEASEYIRLEVDKEKFEEQKENIMESLQALDMKKILILYNYFDEALKACSDENFYIKLMLMYKISNNEYKDYFNQFEENFDSMFNDLETFNKEIFTIEKENVINLFSKKIDKKFHDSVDSTDFINYLVDYNFYITFFSNLDDNDWKIFYQLLKYEKHENWKNIRAFLLYALEDSFLHKNKKQEIKKEHYGLYLEI